MLKCLTIAFVFLTVVVETQYIRRLACEGHDYTCEHCKEGFCTNEKKCRECEVDYRLSSCGDCELYCDSHDVYNETSHECMTNPCGEGYYFDLGL